MATWDVNQPPGLPSVEPSGNDDYTKTCFVIMPFGKKRIEVARKRPSPDKKTLTKVIDFDHVYETVFQPAINSVKLPEGGQLVARRTDKDLFTGVITRDMFRSIEYSRFALADITGLNANVFLELGFRYRARPSGTAVFRLPDAPIPFDIKDIKAFAYEYRPDDRAEESRQLITHVLTTSLVRNEIDSPIQLALNAQQEGGPALEAILIKAEDAIRQQDWKAARQYYDRALAIQPTNPLLHFKVGLMWRQLAQWDKAITAFSAAVKYSPEFGDAYRELGIAQNKQFPKTVPPEGLPALERAIALNPDDFDALSSLGGVLRRAGRNEEALECYRRATKTSLGHPYPLLNELKLEVIVNGNVSVFKDRTLQLRRADQFRRGQVMNDPPIDSPWSFFDLAEVQLYLGKPNEFLELIDKGVMQSRTRTWEARTLRETLELLANSLRARNARLPDGLESGIAFLKEAEPQLLGE